MIGRNDNIAYGITSSLVDNTDIWEEEINETQTQYKVDGEWRDLQSTTETIKIRGDRVFKYQIQSTHRGPLLDHDLLNFISESLFGFRIPNMKTKG